MITADGSPIFPECPTFGYTAEPQYLVKITAREGGFERRQRVWSRPLTKYTAVPLGDRAQADILNVYSFWHAMGGMSTPFRFKDELDFKSCALDFEPHFTDQPIVSDGTHFRLAKQYSAAGIVQQREIFRPVGSTITVANSLGALQDAANWTLDEATGIVVPGGGFTGTPGFWGGEFYVWVRFDAQFNPAISNHKSMNATVQLTELRQRL